LTSRKEPFLDEADGQPHLGAEYKWSGAPVLSQTVVKNIGRAFAQLPESNIVVHYDIIYRVTDSKGRTIPSAPLAATSAANTVVGTVAAIQFLGRKPGDEIAEPESFSLQADCSDQSSSSGTALAASIREPLMRRNTPAKAKHKYDLIRDFVLKGLRLPH
jgi:hypothetical protein